MRRELVGIAAVVLVATVAPGTALASHGSVPDAGRRFEPRPVSQPLYGVKVPGADPARQRHVVLAADGTELFTETWLPAARNGHEPAARIPTVLALTPYAVVGRLGGAGAHAPLLEALVRRGYAVAQAHVRGTGASGGCVQIGGPLEQDDGARIVEYLGRDAPWSNGRVGMEGYSQVGGSQFTVATSSDRARVRYLKAIAPGAPNVSQYPFVMADGAPFLLGPEGIYGLGQSALATLGLYPTGSADSQDRAPRALEGIDERAGCPSLLTPFLEANGDFSRYWAQRETRLHLGQIRAAMLLNHGIPDRRVSIATVSGVFDGLPRKTPRVGIFGWWRHGPPDDHPHAGWRRADWLSIVVSWFDRYLKRAKKTGVARWPRVQVQGSDGQWRSEDNWPRPAARNAQLALSSDGTLGAVTPSGTSSYREESPVTALTTDDPQGTSVAFRTPPLADRLEISGEPVLDLWLTVDQPAANIPAKLEALGPNGKLTIPEAVNVGIRSVRHLHPLRDGSVFVQEHGEDAPLNQSIHVRVRLRPTQLVVPKGGSLRLTIGGSPGVNDVPSELGLPLEGPTKPSGSPTHITVFHDCTHPSVLRFTTPRRRANLLNVHEDDEGDRPLADTRKTRSPISTGAGLATAPVCGAHPISPYAGL